MNIVVCIKQVPDTVEVKLNKETNTIIREGVVSVINPYDMYAVEEALRIREKLGGKVTVLSMGIPSVVEQLKETLAMGADEAILLSDRAFAGSDTLATAYALAKGIEKLGKVDLVLFGKQASDGDTAQVGPSTAEKLGLPHTTYVRKIEEINNETVICRRMTEDGHEIVEMPLPAALTVVKEINEPRLLSLKGMLKAKDACVTVLTADDIAADKNLCGLKGSPTQVLKTFVPDHSVKVEMLRGTPQKQAKLLVSRLISNNLEVSDGFNKDSD